MAKKQKNKFDLGGVVQSLFSPGTTEDPMSNYVMQAFQKKRQRPNYIEDPNTTLAMNSIAQAKAMEKAATNPWTTGLDIAGTLAMQYGMDMASKGSATKTLGGEEASTNGFSGFINSLFGGKSPTANTSQETFEQDASKIYDLFKPFKDFMAAYGGTVGNKVEVEGEEVGQLPNGQLVDFQGPKHEQGGIKTVLPDNTNIYSDRISVNDKTMAERKKRREKRIEEITKLLAKDKNNKILKNTLKRLQQNAAAEEAKDLALQQQVRDSQEQSEPIPEAKYGLDPIIKGLTLKDVYPEYSSPFTMPTDVVYNNTDPTEIQEVVLNKKSAKPFNDIINSSSAGIIEPTYNTKINTSVLDEDNTIPGIYANPIENTEENSTNFLKNIPTSGDFLGMWGNLKQAYDPYFNTLENRAGDTPNVNSFKDFGKDTLKVLNDSKNFVDDVKDQNLKDIELSRSAAISRNRNTARGVNTMRALDLASDNIANNAIEQVYTNFANQMMGILGQEAQAEMQQDQAVMAGEQGRDLADRQDRDMFYSNLAKDKQAIGEGLSMTGKSMNDIKERNVNNEFLNSLAQYLNIDVKNGKISKKDGVTMSTDSTGNNTIITNNTPVKDIPDSAWNNYINPETGKEFTSAKEYKKVIEKRKDNPYYEPFAEANTDYKKYIKEDGSKFTSKKDYEQYLEAGRKTKEYNRLTGEGNSFVKNYNTESNKKTLTNFLNNQKLEVNLDNEESVKALQKFLGLATKYQTGKIGKITLEAIKKFKK